MAPRRNSERGAALLVVMVAVAVLTILAVQLAYDTRVSLQIAANARDDLRATYLAKSGVNISRLVLSFQQKIDQMTPSIPGQQNAGMGMPRIQLWRLVQVRSSLAGGLFGGASAPKSEARPPAPSDGEAAGAAPAHAGDGFETTIDDEARKVSAHLDAIGTSGFVGAQVQSFFQLICDPRWDALFDREGQNGVRVSRQDLLVYLRDWIDENEQGSALVASFPAGGCAIIVPPNPFEDGFQDENYAYDRGPDRYHAKNARMDSLDELYMIAGVGDAFMAAFGRELTAYVLAKDKQNVNTTDLAGLLRLATFVADPASAHQIQDPKFGELLQAEAVKRTYSGMVAITPAEFGGILQSLGITPTPARLADLTDRSSVFSIRAQGKAGAVLKVLDAVVRTDDTQQLTSPVPGRLVHWHEE